MTTVPAVCAQAAVSAVTIRRAAVIGNASAKVSSIGMLLMVSKRVRLLFDGRLEPGVRAIEWNGDDDQGQPVPRGLYFLRATQGGAAQGRHAYPDWLRRTNAT